MAEYGIWGYLAKAHHAQLMREAAIARGTERPRQARSLASILRSLVVLLVPLH